MGSLSALASGMQKGNHLSSRLAAPALEEGCIRARGLPREGAHVRVGTPGDMPPAHTSHAPRATPAGANKKKREESKRCSLRVWAVGGGSAHYLQAVELVVLCGAWAWPAYLKQGKSLPSSASGESSGGALKQCGQTVYPLPS